MALFYIATSLSRAKEHNIVRNALVSSGHKITYDWTVHGSVKCTTTENLSRVAHNEMEGVVQADMVIVLLPGGKGTHIELGAALATNKKVFIHSNNERHFIPCEETCAFYHHGAITKVVGSFDNIEELILAINGEAIAAGVGN